MTNAQVSKFRSGMWRVPTKLLLAAALSGANPAALQAHAFEVRYNLPVPLWLYLIGAGLTVALSFVVLVVTGRKTGPSRAKSSLVSPPFFRPLAHPVVLHALEFVAVALLAIVLIAGFTGPPFAAVNFASLFVWVVWWVGMAFVVALFGNLWPLVNPWRAIFRWTEALYRLFDARRLSLDLRFPARLVGWPATALLVVFVWLELVFPQRQDPRTLAWLVLGYSALTWIGMWLFGRQTWLKNGEVFTKVFDLFGRFAPLYALSEDGGGLRLRPYAAGLADARAAGGAQTAFVMILLASLTFDGFSATPLWSAARSWFYFSFASGLGADGLVLTDTAGLALFLAGFSGLYLSTCWLASRAVRPGPGTGELARRFALSLVPIALAYHLAHYFTYLFIQGQRIVPLLSDPFGRGWDILGTAGYAPNPDLVSAGLVWAVAVGAVVIGHVYAVWLAHREARKIFGSSRNVLRSQLPMLLLMIGYTMTSLWILAQPVVEQSGR